MGIPNAKTTSSIDDCLRVVTESRSWGMWELLFLLIDPSLTIAEAAPLSRASEPGFFFSVPNTSLFESRRASLVDFWSVDKKGLITLETPAFSGSAQPWAPHCRNQAGTYTGVLEDPKLRKILKARVPLLKGKPPRQSAPDPSAKGPQQENPIDQKTAQLLDRLALGLKSTSSKIQLDVTPIKKPAPALPGYQVTVRSPDMQTQPLVPLSVSQGTVQAVAYDINGQEVPIRLTEKNHHQHGVPKGRTTLLVFVEVLPPQKWSQLQSVEFVYDNRFELHHLPKAKRLKDEVLPARLCVRVSPQGDTGRVKR